MVEVKCNRWKRPKRQSGFKCIYFLPFYPIKAPTVQSCGEPGQKCINLNSDLGSDRIYTRWVSTQANSQRNAIHGRSSPMYSAILIGLNSCKTLNPWILLKSMS